MRFFILLSAAISLFAETKVLLFSASTREGSYNQQLIQEAEKVAKAGGAKTTLISLKDFAMPFYDGDLEAESGIPEAAKRLRDLMAASDAIVIATPEYNGYIPGLLKNTLDWISRDQTRVAFKGKKFAVMSASPSGYGGARALNQLSALIQELSGTVIEQRTTVPKAYEALNEKLKNNPDLQQEIKQLL